MDQKLHLFTLCCFLKLVPSDELCVTQYITIYARPGDTVILPCKFNVFQNILNTLWVVWQKTNLEDIIAVDLGNSPGNGEAIQDNKYKSRTRIQQDWTITGHPNLTLYNVSTADLGNYTCYISTDRWTHRCADVHITLTFQQADTSDKGKNITKGDQETTRFPIAEREIIIIITAFYVAIAFAIVIIACCRGR